MTHFDLTPLYRSTVGFDRLASLIDSFSRFEGEQSGFPPYDIVRVKENEYKISIALAGFSKDELDIQIKENTLTVRGEKKTETEDKKNGEILHRGIATRSFTRRFQLADHVEVREAELENGLLHIHLVREIPETLKARSIPIGGSEKGKLLEGNVN